MNANSIAAGGLHTLQLDADQLAEIEMALIDRVELLQRRASRSLFRNGFNFFTRAIHEQRLEEAKAALALVLAA